MLIAEIKKQCDSHNLKCHIVRVESNLTNQGIPDIYCCVRGRQFWIECKYRATIVTPMQVSFMEQEIRAAGKVFVVRYREHWQLDGRQETTLENVVGAILARIL